jgi:hypothetical protein
MILPSWRFFAALLDAKLNQTDHKCKGFLGARRPRKPLKFRVRVLEVSSLTSWVELVGMERPRNGEKGRTARRKVRMEMGSMGARRRSRETAEKNRRII